MTEPDLLAFASVWDAIEVSPDQATSLRLRSDILFALIAAIERWRTTQVDVGALLGLTPSRLDDIAQGRIDTFSLDDLVALAGRAGITLRVESVSFAA